MSGKRKLQHFAEMETFSNVIQPRFEEVFRKDHELKGNWASSCFGNDHPIVLELGCGKGEYTVNMGRMFPEKNFIGMDVKGARIWRGAKTALEDGMDNVRFIRSRIEHINSFFDKDEVSEIWITFPDPQPQESREKKRLTSPRFQSHYREFLKKNGPVHLKTDAFPLYEYTLELAQSLGLKCLEATNDLYGIAVEQFDEETRKILDIKTHYEQIFLKEGKQICYLKFLLQ